MPTTNYDGRTAAGTQQARDSRDRILLKRFAESGDPALRAELIERFMPLARSLAWRYRSAPEPMEDLLQVAAEGLVRAVDGYDVSRSNGFSSYATPMILGALRHYFRDSTHAVHVPRGLQERIQKINSETERATAEYGIEPTPGDLAERTTLKESEVLEALAADSNRRPLSIDMPSRPQEEGGLAPMVESLGREEPGFERVESTLASQGADLDQRERAALRLRFGKSMNQREIGEQIGVSQMQVSRLLRRSLDKLLASVQG